MAELLAQRLLPQKRHQLKSIIHVALSLETWIFKITIQSFPEKAIGKTIQNNSKSK